MHLMMDGQAESGKRHFSRDILMEEKIITKKGDKNVYLANNNDEKENLTVLLTANAAGNIPPPMIVFSYESIPSHIAHSVPPSWGIGTSESGWMCGPVFYEYVTNTDMKHLTLHVSEFCSENGIELMSLYPNSTHQPQLMEWLFSTL
ncbi:hypothetical protein PR048_000389 [Dryococelus australis]|uniref:DDE-1 domain-containing protein n=1 Tax=Dryococelus australis TaxID=614101 RepID=A0ABQ9IEI7_9NEOP|nr:hypothetical protein PR048_000389 [Dryococelus australis]